MTIKKIGVVGAGVMGSQIAGIMGFNGFDVVLKDINQEFLDNGISKIRKSLEDLVKFHAGRSQKEIEKVEKNLGITLTSEQKNLVRDRYKPAVNDEVVEEVLGKIEPTTEWKKFSDVDIAIEATFEDIDVKKQVFQEMEKTCSTDAILASNTSTLLITEIASVTNNPHRIMGIHFFNPPTRLPLVEVIPSIESSEKTVSDCINFLAELKNHVSQLIPIKVKETPGFLVNRILLAMLDEAFACYEEGVADTREIDRAMKSGAGHPLGPFELADLIGIDILHHIKESMTKMNGGNVASRPVQIIKRLYYANRLGMKVGRGFYDYD